MNNWDPEKFGKQLGESERGLATRYEPKVDAPPFRRCAAQTKASSKRGAQKSAQTKRAQKAIAGLGGGS